MTYRVWGRPVESSAFSGTNLFQSFQVTAEGLYTLRAIRTWLVFYNDPTFTDIHAKLYWNRVVNGKNTPIGLIATSGPKTKAEVLTSANGVNEVGFEFNDVQLISGITYNVVINGTGYSFSDSSHIGWKHSFPDSNYPGHNPSNLINLGTNPFQISIIGGQF